MAEESGDAGSGDQPQRFAFLGFTRPVSSRVWGGALLVGALVIQFVLDSTAGIVIALATTIPALVMIVRPPKHGFYVEVTDRQLVLQAVVTNRIDFGDIASVGVYVPSYSLAWIRFVNVVIEFNRLFGGSPNFLPPPGEPDDRAVEVKFRRRIAIFLPFPPFIWPRTGWLLRIEDAAALRTLLQSKLEAT